MTRFNPLHDARVSEVLRDRCVLQFSDGERIAEITGRFRYGAETAADFPVVGDWVSAEILGPDSALIHSIRPRVTTLSRKASGQTLEEQVLAANVDVAFIVTSYNEDFNIRRLERYLALAKQAGLQSVILINKCDLAETTDPRLAQAVEAAVGGQAYRVSAQTGEGLEIVASALALEKTGIFLGSSGVGKSSILNHLFGEEIQLTQTIRVSDGKGRHTTTARQMFKLPQGGFVIDTPGLREIQLWADESVLAEVYADIGVWVRSCRFGDCQHNSEPDCAIRKALESGGLEAGRWAAYLKLQKELAYLKRKQDPEQQANTKRRWMRGHKDIREQGRP